MTFNAKINAIQTYQAGKPIELVVREFGIQKDSIIKLASNENPLGVSKKVTDGLSKLLGHVHLYPDDSMHELKQALASKHQISPDQIIIGAGSDQIIEFCIQAKANHRSKILMARTTFAMYEIYARSVGASIIKTPSHHHNIEEFLNLASWYRPDVLFLCAPNNPLGECLNYAEIKTLLQQIHQECLVVVDGAYQEYATHKDPKKSIPIQELVNTFSNVIYLGTFSKAYGLGGLRVGYGIAQAEIIQALNKLRPPFNITNLSLEAATIALQDKEHLQATLHNNNQQMPRYEQFAKSHGIRFIPSYGNFITYCFDEGQYHSKACAFELLKKGIIIRELDSYGLNAIRITIGTPSQNDRFFEHLAQYLGH